MTNDEKNRISELRRAGMGYLKIAQTLDLNVNTVKTFCRRNGLTGVSEEMPVSVFPGVLQKVCKNCGETFLQYPGHREKVFCCNTCRNKWWNSHLSQVKRKAMYEYTCPTCGRKFSAYGNRNRKYCSHPCYISSRFGGTVCD